MTSLVNDLLDVSRLRSGHFSLQLAPVDLAPLIANTIELAQFLTETQTVRFETDDQHMMVEGDEQRLQQVLLNLLTNAYRYAPDSANIDVRLRREDARWARIAVQDYGPGIPGADQEDLFARFYQTNERSTDERRGLGLGLFIAKQIVEAHGGTIAVASSPGQGATFTIRLPLTSELSAGAGSST